MRRAQRIVVRNQAVLGGSGGAECVGRAGSPGDAGIMGGVTNLPLWNSADCQRMSTVSSWRCLSCSLRLTISLICALMVSAVPTEAAEKLGAGGSRQGDGFPGALDRSHLISCLASLVARDKRCSVQMTASEWKV